MVCSDGGKIIYHAGPTFVVLKINFWMSFVVSSVELERTRQSYRELLTLIIADALMAQNTS